MGLGTLRRYHARPDEGVVSDSGTALSEGGEHPEIVAAKIHLQTVSARESELSEQIAGFAETDDADTVEAVKAEYLEVSQQVENAKQEVEAVELRIKAEADAKDEEAAKFAEAERLAKEAESNKSVSGYEAAGLTRNSKTDDWKAFALANGQTEDTLKGLKRDDIAVLFMGPKQ